MSKKKKPILNTTTIGMGQTVYVQRTGEGASQMIQALEGKRYDSAGNELVHKGRNLRDISNYKVNEDYAENNIKQQAGFSAELVEEARENKEAIMRGDKTRTRTTDGVGKTNDQKNDLIKLDENGNFIEGTGAQMKFYGVTKDGKFKVVEKLAKDDKWDRYDKVLIPKDQYNEAVKYAEEQAAKCREQAAKLRELGKLDAAEKQERLAQRYDKARERLRESKLTSEEAIEARRNPEKFTAREVAKDSVQAGVQAMASAMVISGVIAVAQNTVAVLNGEKDVGDAALDTIDTVSDAGFAGFFVGTTGTALKAVMHTSKSELVRRIGTTTLPTMIATGILDVTKSIVSFAKGDISTIELFQELGEKGVCSIASGMGAGIGGTLGAAFGSVGTIVGGVAGGMAAYAVCSAIYNSTIGIINDARYARERRLYLESMCNDAKKSMEEYRIALEHYSKERIGEIRKGFGTFFSDVDRYIAKNDIDSLFVTFKKLDDSFGIRTRFDSFEEFDVFMNDDTRILSF